MIYNINNYYIFTINNNYILCEKNNSETDILYSNPFFEDYKEIRHYNDSSVEFFPDKLTDMNGYKFEACLTAEAHELLNDENIPRTEDFRIFMERFYMLKEKLNFTFKLDIQQSVRFF